MNEITPSTAQSELAAGAGELMEAVSSGTVDADILANFGKLLLSYLPTVIIAILIFIAGKITAKIIMKIIDKSMGRSRIEATAQGFLKSLINITLTAFVIVITLSVLGIPMTSIITVIGAAGVAIGLALQNSLSNVAGGFIILFAKPFSKGDFITSNGIEGTVDEISILSTKLITPDNKVVFIPNGMVSSDTITNYNREEKRRVDLTFDISYDQDFRVAMDIIRDIISEHNLVIKSETPFVRVSALAESSVNISVKVWTKTADYWTVYFDLIENIKTEFDAHNIEIPYRKLDVNILQKQISR